MEKLYNEEEGIEIEVFTLTMEDGRDQEFVILDEFGLDGKNYIVVTTIDENDNIGEDEYIYGCTEEGDDLLIDYIEDDEEYDRVAAAYAALLEEEAIEDDQEATEE